jgi:hypothetical protein
MRLGSQSRSPTLDPRSGLAVVIVSLILVLAGPEHDAQRPSARSGAMLAIAAAALSPPTVSAASLGGDNLCHRTGGRKPFVNIVVAETAVPAHLAHGDGRVGERVPGQTGMEFGEDCSLVPAPPTGPIRFNLAGEVTEVRDPNDVLSGTAFSPAVGDAILGTYTIDPEATGFPLSPELTHYASSPTPPFGMTFQIGSTSFEALPGFLAINIANDEPTVGDRYLLFTTPTAPTLAGITWAQVGFELGTTTNLDVFGSTSLPLSLPNVSLFDTTNQFFLSFVSDTGGIGFVVGRLSAVTRIP